MIPVPPDNTAIGSQRALRVLLVLPDGRIHKLRLGSFQRSMREAPLTLTTLASLSPPDVAVDFTLVDESVERVPLDYEGDLIGISSITGTSSRAYEIADHFRARGQRVVIGGVHATILPEEAAQHADAVVVGPAEQLWPRVLSDCARGRLEPEYRDAAPPAGEPLWLPLPRRDLQRTRRYNVPNTTMATRGCRHACDFCSVPTVTRGYRKRPVGEVVADVATMPGRLMTFNDVSLLDDVEYAKELLHAMIPLRRRWGGLATSRVADDPELLELLERSGCIYLLIGLESSSRAALGEIHKGFNCQRTYGRLMSALHEHGVSVQGCFMFGFDSDETSVFDETVEAVDELGIDIPRYSILTPYPGTPLFERLLAQGRILSVDWDDYDTMHPVFEPARMTAHELFDGFKRAYRRTFALSRILRRARWTKLRGLVNLVGNLTYRRFVRRLQRDPRLALPFNPDARPTLRAGEPARPPTAEEETACLA